MAAGVPLFSKRFLLIAVAICAALQFANVRARRIAPAHRDVAVALAGSFQPEGWYPGEAFAHATGIRGWGSWSGSDDNKGTIEIGPLVAPKRLRFGAGGYPNHAGNELHVERMDGGGRVPVEIGPVGERWHVIDVELPRDWEGQSIRIVGRDNATGIGGWFAITEPIRGARSDGINALLDTLSAWCISGLLLGIVWWSAVRWLIARSALESQWIPLGAAAVVAACGYFAFWAYFTNPLVGRVVSWSVIAAGLFVGLRKTKSQPEVDVALPPSTEALVECAAVAKLMLAVGAFHLAVLHLFPTQHDFYTLAANRFRESLPGDNMLPHGFAERLFAGQPPKNPADEWRSSDRPPLQAGWQLLTWPAAKLLDLDRRTASATSAVWFQLLWVAGAYGLLRTLAVSRSRAAGWVAVFALCGFFAQNTLFTWPKLSAAAFACAGVALFLLSPGRLTRENARWAAAFAGLGWLSHGGVAFSYLALLPWIVGRLVRRQWAGWPQAAAILAGLMLPWMAYQKFYDPPGDQLLKLHLAGQTKVDPRGTWQTIRESYAAVGWREAWAHKVANFHGQVFGDWKHLGQVEHATAHDRRNQEFFHVGRALTWWPILALLALALTRRPVWRESRDLAILTGWLGLTLVLWCLLIFGRYNAGIHHGSYAVMIGLFVLCSVVLERTGRGWLAATAVLQAFTFATTWAVGSTAVGGTPTGLVAVIAATVGIAGLLVRAFRPEALVPVVSPNPPTPWERFVEGWQAWWRKPQLNVWVLLAIAVAMFLRKPHALHTPQLWAEDGSVFLNDQNEHGVRAFFSPYMGYVHALPRIIAWLADQLVDPAWWPAFYNGTAFAIWLAVLARLFTARFDLPGKPWLALAFLVVPHSGEVLFNVTNLQWLTSFVLIQQVLIAPPTTRLQRIADLTILLVVSLTGPFVIAFLPLFAWRWWRVRTRDSLLAFLVVLGCAAVQAWFVVRVGPSFEFQAAPFALWPNLVVLARRLIVWPMLGRDLAATLPPAVIGVIGLVVLSALTVWALRPHPRRRVRAWVLAAMALIIAAAVYRTRPDTWTGDNLDFGDRYFYIPRVLLLWLLVWEFDSVPRWAGNMARVAVLAVVVLHSWTYTLPAPKDYRWREHAEPIRRGTPANIPTLPEGWTLEYRGRPSPK